MSVAFDTLKYTKGAEAVGIKREHAEYQAQQIADVIDNELVTKSYLTSELNALQLSIIKWTIGISIAQAGIVLSMIGFMMKHT